MKILIYGHKIKDEDEVLYFRQLLEALTESGIDQFIFGPLKTELSHRGINVDHVSELSTYEVIKNEHPDFVLTMGGDGTILHTVTMVRDTGIPILGINLGRLGFLASVEKKIIRRAIQYLFKKEYTIVSRSLLGLSSNIPPLYLFCRGRGAEWRYTDSRCG